MELFLIIAAVAVATIITWSVFKQDNKPTVDERISRLEDELILERERVAWARKLQEDDT